MKKRSVLVTVVLAISILLVVFLYNQELRAMTGKIVSDDCLIAHYKFENNVRDYARGNNGKNNGAGFTKGKVDNALILDGVDDYVVIPGIDIQKFNNTEDFTLSTWYMPTSREFSSTDGTQTYFFGGTLSPFGLRLNKVGTQLNLGHVYWIKDLGSNMRVEDSKPIELNRWYHIASTYDHNTETSCLYINAELVKCRDLSLYGGILLVNKNAQFTIGGTPSGYSSPSKIDEAKIWDCALSQEQIIEEYESYGEKAPSQQADQEPTTQDKIIPKIPSLEDIKEDPKAGIIVAIIVIIVILLIIFRKRLKKIFK